MVQFPETRGSEIEHEDLMKIENPSLVNHDVDEFNEPLQGFDS